MDSRLTKKRLSDFLAYEWILMLVIVVVAVVAMELIYTVTATRITTGQVFKYYYDQDLYTYDESDGFYNLLKVTPAENGKTFSYDVLSVESENLVSSYNVLSVRLSVQEGDAVFTSSFEDEENGVKSRAKEIIDTQKVYALKDLLSDAKEYLSQFVKGGGDIYKEEDYDTEKIYSYFNERMKKDNRFRSEEDKADGRIKEEVRIKKLAKDTCDFEKLLNYENSALFYEYTRYEQSAKNDNTRDKTYENLYGKEVEEGRENLAYGINLSALTYSADETEKHDVSKYFKLNGRTDARDVVLLIFDFKDYQPDLQYETISFIDTIVRECSDILG